MRLPVSTFIAGLLFGGGLTVSQMVNPEKVISFLDITGNWDPSLAFVMGGALLVTLVGYRIVLKRSEPLFDEKFRLPTRKDIDAPLLVGAALFGAGWGLAGLCPGPALAGASFAGLNAYIFVGTMIATIFTYRFLKART
ncbi:transporter [Litorimonas cladophorae]|uniref:Transporter n=1 Tax=Litorimonas cladophorae TaxID=1220491 RepID=A0A918KFU6_9PROT|nr:DUF6691 family protein [Litorimonas cladophorae]GGX62117.1 transporter [Litorimonas cladophorae]